MIWPRSARGGPHGRIAIGVNAATGRRSARRAAIRSRIVRELRRRERFTRDDGNVDFLEIIPGSGDPAVVADVAARINWYLAGRTIPVWMEGAAETKIHPSDAPWMDPALVRNPGWEERRPKGRSEVVIVDLVPRTLVRYLSFTQRLTLASPLFATDAESGWFDLHRRYGAATIASVQGSADLLLSLARPAGTAFVLATGPSAAQVDPKAVTADIRIICNSAVRDETLLRELDPTVVAFADPVFHCGPSRYAAQFRSDLLRALDVTDAVLLTIDRWSGPVLANCPQLARRLIVLRSNDHAAWRWPTSSDSSVKTTSNVLTLLMLPAAFALSTQVEIAGCDGRQAGERYFWRHNPQTQYADDLMQAAFATHPAFFRDRDYSDYYEAHCEDLEQLLASAEKQGKRSVCVTPSHIPALRRRGAPSP